MKVELGEVLARSRQIAWNQKALWLYDFAQVFSIVQGGMLVNKEPV